jgi:D-lactate dehydrogenase
MKLIMFDARPYDKDAFEAANAPFGHHLTFSSVRLTSETAPLAAGYAAVCAFVNDKLDAATLGILKAGGTTLIALRSAGFDHVDLGAAEKLGMQVTRVPEYSPYAVAEHAVALLLCLDRHIHKAYARVREGNFSLDGLVGFDLNGKTVGVIGTGRIGTVLIRILAGFGCRILAYDAFPQADLAEQVGFSYVPFETLLAQADVISLHVPLSAGSRHLIDATAIARMKPGVMLINTSRGALVDTRALIAGLKCGQLGAVGLDVYEGEAGVFFSDHSERALSDDLLARLLTFPNVLITGHQAFLTDTALRNIADITLESVSAFERGEPLKYAIKRLTASPTG